MGRWVSSIQFSVVRCLHVACRDENWRKSSMFYTCRTWGREVQVDDYRGCVNIIYKTVVEKIGLKAESYPQPYNGTCINKTSQSITQHRRVPIQRSSYLDRLWCDIVEMDVAHILLGWPWLYDLDVTNFGRSNTYGFKINGKRTWFKVAISAADSAGTVPEMI